MTPRPTTVSQPDALAFAPLDKRALGFALGVVLALSIAALTTVSLFVDPQQHFPLVLLREYLVGYEVSARGAFIGSAWMLFIGFIWGWFLAFSRNVCLALWLISLHVRADVAASRVFLDHI